MDTSTVLGLRNNALFELMYSAGMRLIEIENMKINDINFNDQVSFLLEKEIKKELSFLTILTKWL